MTACEYNWIPHLSMEPARLCPLKYHQTSFRSEDPSHSNASSASFEILTILETDAFLLKTEPVLEMVADKKPSISEATKKIKTIKERPEGGEESEDNESEASEFEIRCNPLLLEKESSPSDFEAEHQSKLHSFLYGGDDTDTDDEDIFPPTTIHWTAESGASALSLASSVTLDIGNVAATAAAAQEPR